ncbi:XRE family transcriptional regulator [Roseovarius sp. SYSU LYC5161]|uniref:XRE family transcriptional regulator n=1 Tax=Roseovarius halophilus (ex Wu et al. 2025) TaxID=3376060 RepID=UPI00399B95A8
MSVPMHERLRARIRQLGMSVAKVARAAEVNRSFVYDILRGRSQTPNLDKLTRIADAVKVDREWLLSGKGRVEGDDPITEDYHNDFVAIQYASVRPSMGGGTVVDNEDQPGRNFHFRRAWIHDRLKAAPSMLRVMGVQGDSMTPTLNEGDVVLVDMNRRSPIPSGVFVLHDGMGLVAKRLEHVPMSDPPRVRIISDNHQYSPYECTAEEVNIIGRVRWYGREM